MADYSEPGTPKGERRHVMSGLLGVGMDFRLLEVMWVIADGVWSNLCFRKVTNCCIENKL